MSLNRIVQLGVRVAAWATPHIQRWHRAQHLNRTEGERHLQARNYAEAEKHLTLALNEKHSRKHCAEILTQLAKVRFKLNKLTAAEESARAALPQAGGNLACRWEAVEALAEIQFAQGNTAAAIETLDAMERLEKSSSLPDLKKLATAS